MKRSGKKDEPTKADQKVPLADSPNPADFGLLVPGTERDKWAKELIAANRKADLAPQGDKTVADAISLFESHPDFPPVQVRMRERMAEVERNSPADARYYGTVARLQYVLTRFRLRAEAFWELVSDIPTHDPAHLG